MSVIASVMGSLTPEVLRGIAARLGISPALTRKLSKFAAPALMATLAERAENSVGTTEVVALCKDQPEVDRTTYVEWLSNAQAGQHNAEQIARFLGRLELEDISKAIGQLGGVSPFQAQQLLGMLLPAVAAPLRHKLSSEGYDTFLLAQYLEDEKPGIRDAMPSSVRDRLKGTGIIDGVLTSVRTHGKKFAAKFVEPSVLPNLPQIACLAILTLIVGVATNLIVVGPQNRAEKERAVAQAQQDLEESMLGNKFSTELSTLIESLATVDNRTGAAVALPPLSRFSETLDQLSEKLSTASQPDLDALKGSIGAAYTSLNTAVQNAAQRADAADVLLPVAIDVLEKLDAIGEALATP